MTAPRSLEHAHIHVADLRRALDFYVGLMGLSEVGRENGIVYLGAGLDSNYDLALSQGGSGLDHLAIRTASTDDLERLERELADGCVATVRRDGCEPGQEAAVRFELPSGIAMELVWVGDHCYHEPYSRGSWNGAGSGRTMGVLDIDHLNFVVTDIRRDTDFLSSMLGFRLTEVVVAEDGAWKAAFMRYGDYHHDVMVGGAQNAAEATLHHIGWTCSNLEHLKVCCDLLAAHGIELEYGVGRHPVGANMFAYFLDPGGNRSELSAEMAVVSPAWETRFWSDRVRTLDAWQPTSEPPPSFWVAT